MRSEAAVTQPLQDLLDAVLVTVIRLITQDLPPRFGTQVPGRLQFAGYGM